MLGRGCAMTLLTAHKILISAAIVFFLLYAILELVSFFNSGAFWALGRSALAAAVSVGFIFYFRTLKPF